MEQYKNFGLVISGPGLGDKIIFSSFPENFFKNTGEKLIDVNNYWVFDHNPYVLRGEQAHSTIDVWELGAYYDRGAVIPSLAERCCSRFNFTTYLRHPRLYNYEDSQLKSNQIVVHLSGNTVGLTPEYIANQILENYQGYEIILIGDKDDHAFPGFINKLGLPLWESIKLIAESILFIGIDSSMMNAALCYPRVNKRIILLDNNTDYIKSIIPMETLINRHHWLDHSLTLFNTTTQDLGVTFSYTKI